jgi:uncharacterized repeat protein (TIGR01451 family)
MKKSDKKQKRKNIAGLVTTALMIILATSLLTVFGLFNVAKTSDKQSDGPSVVGENLSGEINPPDASGNKSNRDNRTASVGYGESESTKAVGNTVNTATPTPTDTSESANSGANDSDPAYQDEDDTLGQITDGDQVLSAAQKTLTSLAYQYYNRGAFIQYDDSMLDKDNPSITDEEITQTARKQLGVLPEEAHEQNTIYMDDGAFIYNVYRSATGYRTNSLTGKTTSKSLMDYARINSSTDDTIAYYSASLNQNIKDEVQVGDIITYITTENDFHSVLVIDSGQYMHAIGQNFNYTDGNDNIEQNGALQIGELNTLFVQLINEGAELTIIRPLNRADVIELLEASLRQQYANLKIEKTASVNAKNTIETGSEITYTIKLTNVGDADYSDIVITDSVPSGAELVQGFGGTGSLNITLDLPAGTTETVYFTVRITAVSGQIVSNQTTVAGFTIGQTKHSVGRVLTDDQTVKLTESANAYISTLTPANFKASGNGVSYKLSPGTATQTIGRAGFIRAIYYHAFNVDIRYTYLINAFDALIDSNTWLTIAPSQLSGDLALFAKMQVPDLYGGRELTTFAERNIVSERNERARYVDEAMLMTGDIITYQSGSSYSTYTWIYLKDDTGGRLVRFDSDGIVEVTGEELSELLSSLVAKKRFVVLRPSLAFDF